MDKIREQIANLRQISPGSLNEYFYEEVADSLEKLLVVYEAAQKIIHESRTQENGTEQIKVEPWVALGKALANLKGEEHVDIS